MKENSKTVSLGTYKQVVDLRKQGMFVADIANTLKISKSEVQKVILHFDNITQPKVVNNE